MAVDLNNRILLNTTSAITMHMVIKQRGQIMREVSRHPRSTPFPPPKLPPCINPKENQEVPNIVYAYFSNYKFLVQKHLKISPHDTRPTFTNQPRHLVKNQPNTIYPINNFSSSSEMINTTSICDKNPSTFEWDIFLLFVKQNKFILRDIKDTKAS